MRCAWYDVTARQLLTCGRDGRTRLLIASLANRLLGLAGEEALQGVRRYIPMRSKHLSNNGWYSMMMGLQGHRADGNPLTSSSEYTRKPGQPRHHTTVKAFYRRLQHASPHVRSVG